MRLRRFGLSGAGCLVLLFPFLSIAGSLRQIPPLADDIARHYRFKGDWHSCGEILKHLDEAKTFNGFYQNEYQLNQAFTNNFDLLFKEYKKARTIEDRNRALFIIDSNVVNRQVVSDRMYDLRVAEANKAFMDMIELSGAPIETLHEYENVYKKTKENIIFFLTAEIMDLRTIHRQLPPDSKQGLILGLKIEQLSHKLVLYADVP